MISDSKTTIQFSGGGISARKRAEMVFDGSGTRTDNGWVYVYAGKKAVTFNTIQFRETAEAAGRIVVEVPDEAGGWRPIYRQDEIGRRTGVLDETVTADAVRVTVDWDGDLSMESILLTTQQPVIRQRPFRVVSYYPFRPEDNRKNYDKLDVITDLILLPQIAYTSDGLLPV